MQVKFDLSDWQGRRARLLPILEEAAQAGLVPPGGDGKLGDFLLGRGVDVAAAPPLAEPAGEGLDTRRASEPVSPVEESEAPRFIRGFHDILITIGLVVGLVGLGGLASIYAVIPAAIVLAEILVRRQRLALPAVTLTAAIGLVVAICVLEESQRTNGIITCLRLVRVILHLANVEVPVCVKCPCDRVVDQWFMSDELHLEAVNGLERLEDLLDGQGWLRLEKGL